jgi:hypothetical protein
MNSRGSGDFETFDQNDKFPKPKKNNALKILLLVGLLLTLCAAGFITAYKLVYKEPNGGNTTIHTKWGEASFDIPQAQKVVNVLILGFDKDGYRTDTMMIANFDPKTSNMNLVSIPRDTLVEVKGKRMKLNSVFAIGKIDMTIKAIREIRTERKKHTISLCQFFYLVKDLGKEQNFSESEFNIVNALKGGPLSIRQLAEAVNGSIYDLNVKRLEQLGIIMRGGLTPTDIMHLKGDFSVWNEEAAEAGAAIMAFQLSIEVSELTLKVYRRVKENLYFNIVKMLLNNEYEMMLKNGVDDQLSELITETFLSGCSKYEGKTSGKGFITSAFSTDLTLVGIGAPTHIFLPDIAGIMKTKCVIPQNAGVANAVGAITGNVIAEARVTIKPLSDAMGVKGYACYSNDRITEFEDYSDAVVWAKNEASLLSGKIAEERGAGIYNVSIDVNENTARIYNFPKGDISPQKTSSEDEYKLDKMLIETTVTARAAGKLKYLS